MICERIESAHRSGDPLRTVAFLPVKPGCDPDTHECNSHRCDRKDADAAPRALGRAREYESREGNEACECRPQREDHQWDRFEKGHRVSMTVCYRPVPEHRKIQSEHIKGCQPRRK